MKLTIVCLNKALKYISKHCCNILIYAYSIQDNMYYNNSAFTYHLPKFYFPRPASSGRPPVT